MKATALIAALLGGSLLPVLLPAQTVVSENFNDGTYTSGPSSTDLQWYASSGTTGALSVITDTTLDATGLVFQSTAGNIALANLPSTLTLAVGTTLTVSISFRFPTITANDGLRVGLFSNNGTVTSATGLANSSDDYGMWANYSMATLTTNGGTMNGATETGTNSTIFLGTDRTFASSGPFTPDTNDHTLVLTYTRPATGTYGLSFSLDGGTAISLSTTALTNYNPNEIALYNGGADSLEVDNLVITSSAVPEPPLASLLGLALLPALFLYLRRTAPRPR